MAQIFHRSMNVVSRVSIFGAIFFLAGLTWVGAMVVRSPWATRVDVVRFQPVPFSHEHHVNRIGLDCRYCHTSVESSSFAGIPPLETCMTCHSQVWADSPLLEPVRTAYRTGAPLEWTRVHDLPDFVYFDHQIHVSKGVGCESCHGRVDLMPLAWRNESLHMDWCLSCHRHPAPHLRPREDVFTMGWERADGPTGEELMQTYDIETSFLDDCSVCHR